MIDKNKVIQDLYSFTHDEAGRSAACNYMFDDFPIIERHFDIVDEILDELDLTKINSQLLYNIVWMTSNYIHYLKNYRTYYKKVIAEAERRGYSEKKIVDLFEKLEDGGNFLYDPNRVKSPPYKFTDKEYKYIEMKRLLGDEEIKKRTVIALRALADKIESPGSHFIIDAELPVVPIFGCQNGDDDQISTYIRVALLAHPMGS